MERDPGKHPKTCLSVVIPCFNERETLRECLERVLSIGDSELSLQIIIVDDCSTDGSHAIALELSEKYPEQVTVLRHQKNQGKGRLYEQGLLELGVISSAFKMPTWNTTHRT